MSEKIPYHTSLTIGNIINPDLKKKFDEINNEIKTVERAKDQLNSFMSSYRSIEMTEREINSLSVNIETKELQEYKTKLIKSIEDAAKNYVTIKLEKEEIINQLQLSLDQQDDKKFIESPIDYGVTENKYFPWAVESLKLDYQYFSFKGNQQTSQTMDNIKSFLNQSTQSVSDDKKTPMTNEALSQLQSQHENHDVKGTLVMSATCTHKNVMILEPLKLDPHKAVNAWNDLYKDDQIDIKNQENLLKISQSFQENEKKMTLLSGAVYGSCFIAMVHFLKKNKTNSYQHTGYSLNEIQKKLTLQKWLAHEMGNIKIDKSQEAYIKNLVSDEDIDIHLNLYVTGAIPNISSKEIQSGVREFSTKDSGQEKLISSTVNELKSLDANSTEFQKHAQALSVRNLMASQLLNSLTEIDKKENSVLDVNTMVTAFGKYVKKITSSDSDSDESVAGVPIHYYTKSYTKAEIIKLWLEKYKNNSLNQESE